MRRWTIQPTTALIFVLMVLVVHVVSFRFWKLLQTGTLAPAAEYRMRRIAQGFRGIPMEDLAAALARRLPESTPIALAPRLREDPFASQRLWEGLYPRRIVPEAPNVLHLNRSTDDVLAVWPGRGHFVLIGTGADPSTLSELTADRPLAANWSLFFICLAAVVGLGGVILKAVQYSRVELFSVPASFPLWLGMAGLAGATFLAVVMSIATWFQTSIPFHYLLVAGLIGLAALCVSSIRKQPTPSATLVSYLKQTARSIVFWMGTIAAGVFAFILSRLPIAGWDGRSIWFFRAHQLAHAGMFHMNDVANPAYLVTHPAYPLLFPAWLASFSTFTPFDERQASLAIAVLLGFQLLVLGALIRRHAGTAVATLVSLAFYLAAVPPLQQGYPDLLVTGFLLIATVAFASQETRFCGFLALAAGALTKREGLVLGFAVLLIHLIFSPSFSTIPWRKRLACLACLAPAVLHAVWFRFLGLPELYANARLPGGAAIRQRLGAMFTQFLDLAPSMPVVTLALVGLAILVLVRVPGAGRSTGYPAGFCALAAFGFTILVFLTTPLGFQWHMDRAFDRIVVHGCWLAVAAGLLHLISGDLATSGSKVAPGPDGPS